MFCLVLACSECGLVRLAGLRSEDLIGHSDPYVIMRVSDML
jgi:hypothetical protein